MNYKPEESTLIAYLYGELSAEETKKVEAYLSGNADAQKELADIESARSVVGKLKDREVDIPTFTFDSSSRIVVGKGIADTFWKRSLAIAASIALILIAGYLTGFNASLGKDGVELAFGEKRAGYDQAQVEEMIAEAISKNNASLNQELKLTQASLREYVSDNNQMLETKYASQVSNRSAAGESDFDLQRQQYLSYLKQLIEDSEQSQRKYTDQVMTDFAIFLDIQRQNDLNIIQTRFNNIQDNADQNLFQTNQILSNLISSTEQPNQY